MKKAQYLRDRAALWLKRAADYETQARAAAESQAAFWRAKGEAAGDRILAAAEARIERFKERGKPESFLDAFRAAEIARSSEKVNLWDARAEAALAREKETTKLKTDAWRARAASLLAEAESLEK